MSKINELERKYSESVKGGGEGSRDNFGFYR